MIGVGDRGGGDAARKERNKRREERKKMTFRKDEKALDKENEVL